MYWTIQRILFLAGGSSKDSVFLYPESYFWLITVFLLVGGSFSRPGLLVIALAIVLGVLFYLIKNSIDRTDKRLLYTCSVLFSIVSWGLRACFDEPVDYTMLLISFSTAFFRLAFNSRFFDSAEKGSLYQYLFFKSYYSQASLAVGFGVLGWWISVTGGLSAKILELC